MYALILVSACLIPKERMDVARLRPVEVIAIYKLDHGVAIATDTGDMGYGTDVAIALEDMRQTSPGVIYLDTAEYLLFNSEADGEVVRIRKELKKTIKLCHTTGGIDLGQAAQYLPTHAKLPCLRRWKIGDKLPILAPENGSIKILENHENNS